MRASASRGLTSSPTVSVVIPHYNYGAYLPTAVGSALEQDGVNVEVIIVDDKSTDGSTDVAQGLAASDDRISLVIHEHNMKHIRTYNDGLSRATGEYVVLLSADDALTPNSLTRAVALMEKRPEVGIVYGSVHWFSEDFPRPSSRSSWWQIWSGEGWIDRVARRGRNVIVNPEVVMRRSVFEQTGGYDLDFPHAADMFMWLQAAALSDVGFIGGPRQACYRTHGQNMHTVDFGGLLDDMRQVRDVYERFFATDGSKLSTAGQMSDRAMQSVAREALLRGLLLSVDSAEPSVLPMFQAFAQETWPRIVGSSTWRWADWAAQPGVRRRIASAGEHLRWSVRSRRSDLVGL